MKPNSKPLAGISVPPPPSPISTLAEGVVEALSLELATVIVALSMAGLTGMFRYLGGRLPAKIRKVRSQGKHRVKRACYSPLRDIDGAMGASRVVLLRAHNGETTRSGAHIWKFSLFQETYETWLRPLGGIVNLEDLPANQLLRETQYEEPGILHQRLMAAGVAEYQTFLLRDRSNILGMIVVCDPLSPMESITKEIATHSLNLLLKNLRTGHEFIYVD